MTGYAVRNYASFNRFSTLVNKRRVNIDSVLENKLRNFVLDILNVLPHTISTCQAGLPPWRVGTCTMYPFFTHIVKLEKNYRNVLRDLSYSQRGTNFNAAECIMPLPSVFLSK
jgi:hypothetical protein